MSKQESNDQNQKSEMDIQSEEDVLQPFLLDTPNIRGRMVRLGPVLNDILQAHDYPLLVTRVLAESLTLTTLLAGMLKFDGVFTLQTKGDGAIPTLVCDMTNDGVLRGYLAFDQEKLDKISAETTDDKTILPKDLIGKGYLAFTVDQKEVAERYQGLVELTGDKIVDCVQHYFKQSEQIKVGIKVFAKRDEDGRWQGSAIMLQELPEKREQQAASDIEDDWRRCMTLLNTATAQEMLDKKLPIHDMIYRLFHEEEIRVFEPTHIKKGCRCSLEKITAFLSTLKTSDLDEYIVDDKVFITCEFCNTNYNFTAQEIKGMTHD